ALDITMNQDASFYIDTRNLRQWATNHLKGKRVLNTFAYTGSLGIAALAAGARVVQTDLNRTFLNLAKQSCAMNGLPISRRDFIAGDFFVVMKQLAKQQQRFDCIFLDPPFFSKTSKGTVDLAQNMTRLINKVRPLVKDGVTVVAVNNAVYLGGHDYMQILEALSDNEFVTVHTRIDVPADCTGYPDTVTQIPLISQAPFNHTTKIAILCIRHRQ
ncbi:MAG: class I SAM-dependent methyltransferase, partial [Deltaproteobacteria bacterium]|nr:class I SAM-dependent methyltransferase [Deltaproteobacteria bacterium]